MRYISIFLIGTIFLYSCSGMKPKIENIKNEQMDIVLMPFIDKERNMFGYINAENLEIVIPAQYDYTGEFIGNYALVNKRVGRRYRHYIINNENKIIIDGINNACIFESENGEMIFALTRNNRGRKLIKRYIGGGNVGIFPYYRFEPTISDYRIFNLTTNKLVIEKDTRSIISDIPHIYFFDNFFSYDNILFEIKNNGDVEISDLNIHDLIERISEERNLNYQKFIYYSENKPFEQIVFYDKELNIDEILENIPDGMRPRRLASDWLVGNINRNSVYPLKMFHPPLYEVRLETYKENGEFDESFVALYNAAENEWAIPPVRDRYLIQYHFRMTLYDGWIAFGKTNILSNHHIMSFENGIELDIYL